MIFDVHAAAGEESNNDEPGGDEVLRFTNREIDLLRDAKAAVKSHEVLPSVVMAGGVAVINVGAATESELGELKERCQRVIRAVTKAVAGGLLPPAGAPPSARVS